MTTIIDHIHFDLLVETLSYLDKKQKTKMSRVSKLMNFAATETVHYHCIPFRWGGVGGFGKVIEELSKEPIPGAVLFTAKPNVRYIGSRDEELLEKFLRHRSQISTLAFQNVCVAERFAAHISTVTWTTLNSVMLLECRIRLSARLEMTRSHEWEVMVSQASMALDNEATDPAKAMKRMLRSVMRGFFEGMEVFHLEWMTEVAAIVDNRYPDIKAGIISYLRRRGYKIGKPKTFAEIDFRRVEVKDVALISKFFIRKIGDRIPHPVIRLPGKLYGL